MLLPLQSKLLPPFYLIVELTSPISQSAPPADRAPNKTSRSRDSHRFQAPPDSPWLQPGMPSCTTCTWCTYTYGNLPGESSCTCLAHLLIGALGGSNPRFCPLSSAKYFYTQDQSRYEILHRRVPHYSPPLALHQIGSLDQFLSRLSNLLQNQYHRTAAINFFSRCRRPCVTYLSQTLN